MSETPISDSTPHNVADLGMQIRRLERKLNAANAEVERLTNKVAQLYEGAEEQNQRIKRLEEAGDELLAALQDDWSEYIEWINESTDAVGKWKRAKEAKL